MLVVLLSHMLALGADQGTIVIRHPVPEHDRHVYEFTCNGRMSSITWGGDRGGQIRIESFVVEGGPLPADELALVNRLVGNLQIEEVSAFNCDGEAEQVESRILIVFNRDAAARANRRHIMTVTTRGNAIQSIRGLTPPPLRPSSPPGSAQPGQ